LSESNNLPGRTIEEISASIRAHAVSMAMSYIAIGRDLIEAKGKLGHGEWLPWLSELGFSSSAASNYMRLAREIPPDSMIGALPVSKALALLHLPAEERETFAQANNVQDQSAEEIKRLIRERDEARQALERAKDKAQRDFNAMDRASCAKQARIYALEKELKEEKQKPTIRETVEVKPADYEELKRRVGMADQMVDDAMRAAVEAEERAQSLAQELERAQAENDEAAEPKGADALISAVNDFLARVQILPFRAEEFSERDRKGCRMFVGSVRSWCDQMSAALDAPTIRADGAVVE
jgi:hypothetical protein